MPPAQPFACAVPPELTHFPQALKRTARRLAAGRRLIVVALGSSTTGGAGATAPDFAYPARLVVELQARWPERPLTVLNQGVNGENASDMLARFDADVTAHDPDLVIWQLGTNWLLQDRTVSAFNAVLRTGLRRLTLEGRDIVLMDPQFAPPVIEKPDLPVLLQSMADIAAEFGINLFQRFAIMRHWHEVAGIPFEAFLADDELHMNDWGYGCIAKLLAGAIVAAVDLAPSEAIY